MLIWCKPDEDMTSSRRTDTNYWHSGNAKSVLDEWGLNEYVTVHTKLLPTQVILWMELWGGGGGQAKMASIELWIT